MTQAAVEKGEKLLDTVRESASSLVNEVAAEEAVVVWGHLSKGSYAVVALGAVGLGRPAGELAAGLLGMKNQAGEVVMGNEPVMALLRDPNCFDPDDPHDAEYFKQNTINTSRLGSIGRLDLSQLAERLLEGFDMSLQSRYREVGPVRLTVF